MKILSIQSSVSFGHVGNSAAVFPLQRLGLTVWPVNTVQFSNHPGHGSYRGFVLTPDMLEEILTGLEERGLFAECDAVLTGYLGDAAIGDVILAALERIRCANPNAIYCCDPVIGDRHSGIYVRPGLPEFFRDRAVPAASVMTPNQFELEYLAGMPVRDLAGALAAADAIRARGPDIVLVTSLRRTDGPNDRIEMLAVCTQGAWLLATPLLPLTVNGTGDLTAALFLGHWWPSGDVAHALRQTAAAVFAILERTLGAGTREIQLIAGQDALVDPPVGFSVEKVRS